MRRKWAVMINAFLFPINTVIVWVLLVSPAALADSSASPSSAEDVFLGSLFTSLGGLKGASVLAAVAILTQLLIKFNATRWADFEGKWKLLIFTGLTLVGGVSGLMITDHLSFTAALLHSSTLATFQVFAHQFYKQITEKDPEPSSPPSA
jgi:hypothetical protein